MTDFYLITGFLGSGKTTFLKNFLLRFKGKRLKLIINEFGNSGVDGEILKSIDAKLYEICGGSIFCSCKLDRFESAMEDCLKTTPDIIIVESSGLSDPTNIKKILENYEDKNLISYKGCVCLVDAKRFSKVYKTARVCKKQLAVADLLLISKTDLVDEIQIEEVESIIKADFPAAIIEKSLMGKTDYDFDLLKIKSLVKFDEVSYQNDITNQRISVKISPIMPLYRLEKFINIFAEDTARIKGFVRLYDEIYLVDCVGAMVKITPWSGGEAENILTVLATKGQNTRKALKYAQSLYSDFVELIF